MGICHRQFTRLTGEKVESFDLEKIPMLRKGTSGYVLVGWENPQLREDIFQQKGTSGYGKRDFRV